VGNINISCAWQTAHRSHSSAESMVRYGQNPCNTQTNKQRVSIGLANLSRWVARATAPLHTNSCNEGLIGRMVYCPCAWISPSLAHVIALIRAVTNRQAFLHELLQTWGLIIKYLDWCFVKQLIMLVFYNACARFSIEVMWIKFVFLVAVNVIGRLVYFYKLHKIP
jgi:hypothetical protein